MDGAGAGTTTGGALKAGGPDCGTPAAGYGPWGLACAAAVMATTTTMIWSREQAFYTWQLDTQADGGGRLKRGRSSSAYRMLIADQISPEI